MSGCDQIAKGVYSISRHPGNGNDEASEKASLGPGDAARRVDEGFEHALAINSLLVHGTNRGVANCNGSHRVFGHPYSFFVVHLRFPL